MLKLMAAAFVVRGGLVVFAAVAPISSTITRIACQCNLYLHLLQELWQNTCKFPTLENKAQYAVLPSTMEND